MVAAAAKEARPGEWIVGRGLASGKMGTQGHSPASMVSRSNTSLNAASPNNPVFLEHVSGHAAFVNDAALKTAGITRDTPNPPGGEITKDPAGNPIGLLNERAQALVKVESEGKADKAIDLAAAECISKGITTFEDAGSPPDVVERFKNRATQLPLRLWVMLRAPNAEITPNMRVIGYGDNHLTVRAIKKYMDGALGSRGAWMLEPYSDLPSTSGLAIDSPEEIARTAEAGAGGLVTSFACMRSATGRIAKCWMFMKRLWQAGASCAGESSTRSTSIRSIFLASRSWESSR